MKMMAELVRRYPRRSAVMLLALLLAGLAEGLGLSTLLPLLSVAVNGGETDGPGAEVAAALQAVGVPLTIGAMLLVIVAGMVLKSLLLLLANRQVGYTVAQVATDLRLDLIDALLASRWTYYLQQPSGALANSVATEAHRAATGYQHGANVLAMAFQGGVYLALAVAVSWQATAASLVAGAALLAVLHRLVRVARKAGARQTALLRSLLSYLTDVLGAVKPLKAMGRDDAADALLRQDTGRLNRAMRREVISREGLRALQEPMLAGLAALGLYLALVHWGLSLASVMVLVFLLVRLLGLLNKMQRRYQQLATQESAYWALQAAISRARAAAERPPGSAEPHLEQSLQLEGVWFGYGAEPVLRGLDLELPAGSFTTLIGPSGAGKSTLVDLLCALAVPSRGRVLVDGAPLTTLDPRRWRRMIGYVPQDPVLLHDTVFSNLVVGRPELTREDAERALRQAAAWEFVSGLPEGLDTVVGERGGRMSGGQRQRIAIARALIHGPRLLILDEATSALDPDSEAAICRGLAALKGQMTVIAVTHQSALMNAADQVYRLSGGRAVLQNLRRSGP